MDVRDRLAEFQIVYLSPSWLDTHSDRERLEKGIQRYIEQCSNSQRRYRNGLALAVPDRRMVDACSGYLGHPLKKAVLGERYSIAPLLADEAIDSPIHALHHRWEARLRTHMPSSSQGSCCLRHFIRARCDAASLVS